MSSNELPINLGIGYKNQFLEIMNKHLGLVEDNKSDNIEENNYIKGLITKSKELIKTFQYDEAYKLISEALKTHPNHYDLIIAHIEFLSCSGKNTEALDLIEKEILNNQNNNELKKYRLKYLLKLERYTPVYEEALKLSNLFPNDLEFNVYISYAYLCLGLYNECFNHSILCLQRFPDILLKHPYIFINYIKSLVYSNRLEEARAQILSSPAEGAFDVKLFLADYILFKQGKFDEFDKHMYINQAIEMRSEPLYLCLKTRIEYQRGNKQEALNKLNQIFLIMHDHPWSELILTPPERAFMSECLKIREELVVDQEAKTIPYKEFKKYFSIFIEYMLMGDVKKREYKIDSSNDIKYLF
jgi:tetratricopeptide (TPR) repeat protein